MCFAAKEAQDHCQAEHKVSGSPFGGANRVNQDLRKQARKRKALASGKSFVGKKVLQEWESPGGSTAIDYEGCVCNWSALMTACKTCGWLGQVCGFLPGTGQDVVFAVCRWCPKAGGS